MTYQDKQELQQINHRLLGIQNIINNILNGMKPADYAKLESETETAFLRDEKLCPETQAIFTLLLERIRRDYY